MFTGARPVVHGIFGIQGTTGSLSLCLGQIELEADLLLSESFLEFQALSRVKSEEL